MGLLARDRRHSLLLVLVWFSPLRLRILVQSLSLSPREPCRHQPFTRSGHYTPFFYFPSSHFSLLDCSLPFFNVNRRSRSRRVLRTPAIAHDHRRYLSRQFGLSSWRSSSPGRPSPLSPPSSPQFAQSQSTRQGICSRTRFGLFRVWVCEWESEGVGCAQGSGGSGQGAR